MRLRGKKLQNATKGICTPSELILTHYVKCNELQPELLSLSKKENKLILHTNNMSRHMSL